MDPVTSVVIQTFCLGVKGKSSTQGSWFHVSLLSCIIAASQGSSRKPHYFLFPQLSLHLTSFSTTGRDLELLHQAHSTWMYTVLFSCYRNKFPNSYIIPKPGEKLPNVFSVCSASIQFESSNIYWTSTLCQALGIPNTWVIILVLGAHSVVCSGSWVGVRGTGI